MSGDTLERKLPAHDRASHSVLDGTAGTTLLASSHGTSDPRGRAAVAALVDAVAAARPESPVIGGFVDVQQPDVATCIDAIDVSCPIVIVPLLLSAGYHVHVDLAEAAADAAPRPVLVTGALGPDPRLAVVLGERLRAAGLRDTDRIVLAAAGSSNGGAVADCRLMADHLAAELDREVSIGFLSAAEPRLASAVASERDAHPRARVVVASFLLAPGYFARLAVRAGGDVTTEPLLVAGEPVHPLLVDIVTDRFDRGIEIASAGIEMPSNRHVSRT